VGHAQTLGDGYDDVRCRVGHYVTEDNVHAGAIEHVADVVGHFGAVHQGAADYVTTQLGELGDVAVHAGLYLLPDAGELRPVSG